jgi:hypothetical protein
MSGLVTPFQSTAPTDEAAQQRYQQYLAEAMAKRKSNRENTEKRVEPYTSRSVGALRALSETLGGAFEGYAERKAAAEKAKKETATQKTYYEMARDMGMNDIMARGVAQRPEMFTQLFENQRQRQGHIFEAGRDTVKQGYQQDNIRLQNQGTKEAQAAHGSHAAAITASQQGREAFFNNIVKPDLERGAKVREQMGTLGFLREAWKNTNSGGFAGYLKEKMGVNLAGGTFDQIAQNMTTVMAPTMHIAGSTSDLEFNAYRNAYGSIGSRPANNILLVSLRMYEAEKNVALAQEAQDYTGKVALAQGDPQKMADIQREYQQRRSTIAGGSAWQDQQFMGGVVKAMTEAGVPTQEIQQILGARDSVVQRYMQQQQQGGFGGGQPPQPQGGQPPQPMPPPPAQGAAPPPPPMPSPPASEPPKEDPEEIRRRIFQ